MGRIRCSASTPLHCAFFFSFLLRSLAHIDINAEQILGELLESHTEIQGWSKAALDNILQSYRNGSVPFIIHQTWKDHNIPELNQQRSSTWTQVNPGWLHVVWSDEENRLLVEEHYPYLLAVYDGLPLNIHRVDAIRALILHRYGGIYTDLDSQALRPMYSLLLGKEVVFGQMGNTSHGNSIPNAFMASLPNQRFWLHFLKIIQQHAERRKRHAVQVEEVTGPMALKAALNSYGRAHNDEERQSAITILPPGVIYPVDWSVKKTGKVPDICDWGGHPDAFNSSECIEHFPEAFTIHWWTHSWG